MGGPRTPKKIEDKRTKDKGENKDKQGRMGGKGKKGIRSQMVKTLRKDSDVGELRALMGPITFDDYQFAFLNH